MSTPPLKEQQEQTLQEHESEKQPSKTTRTNAARRNSNLRHAAELGRQSFQASNKPPPKDVTAYVKHTRAVLDFTIMTMVAERAMLDDLAEMSDEEKLEALFTLLDKDGDGALDATELADGLRKIRGDDAVLAVSFEESLMLAIDRIASFDTGSTGKLNRTDFKTLTDSMAETMDTTFHEISEFLVMTLLFSKSGNTVEENMTSKLVVDSMTEAVRDEEAARKLLVDQRMKALFALFDTDGNGSVDFREVAEGLYKLCQDLEEASKAAIVALLLFDHDHSRDLNYEQFARFIIHFIAVGAPHGIQFDDVADGLTKAASQHLTLTTEELSHGIKLQEKVEEAIEPQQHEEEEYVDSLAKTQQARCQKVFKLWDLDHDGTVSLDEMILGLRKFEEASSIGVSVDEAVQLMDAFDVNKDQKLDQKEFVVFLVQFAMMAGTNLDDLLDFMIVTSALNENDEAELKYLKSLTDGDVYYMDERK